MLLALFEQFDLAEVAIVLKTRFYEDLGFLYCFGGSGEVFVVLEDLLHVEYLGKT